MISPKPLILLTGASGFIGNRVQELLLERGCRVRALTRKSKVVFPSPIDRFVGDLTDLSDCRDALAGVNIVIHLAGAKRNPASFWTVNVQGTSNLLAAAVDARVDRFVHVSSVGVIGADPFHKFVFEENVSCNPRNLYEQSKWQAEQLVVEAGHSGLSATVLRPANVFGDGHPEQGLLTLIQAVNRGRFFYLGGREVMCNYVFVDDVARAIIILAEHPNADGRTYHLSDSCTLVEFVEAMAAELDVEKPIFCLPNPLVRYVRVVLRSMRALPVIPYSSAFMRLVSLNSHACFTTRRLVDELEFELPVGWMVGLKRVVDWYRSEGVI